MAPLDGDRFVGEHPRIRRSRLRFAVVLLSLGAAHLIATAARRLPIAPRRVAWTALAGVAEVTSGGLLLSERTRRVGAWAAAATVVAVAPASLATLVHGGGTRSGARAWASLPLRAHLVAWAVRLARR